MEAIAVDWSGAAGPTTVSKHICLARARDGRLLELVVGLSRDRAVAAIIERALLPGRVIVGLDFGFSMPAWYLLERGIGSACELWRSAAVEGEQWLSRCDPPFWGRPGKCRPDLEAHMRLTESRVAPVGGIRPKSVFQLGGAGSVGTGSIRGMPALLRLQEAGCSIWPFDEPRFPLVVEIWPRLFTGPVAKNNAECRREHLSAIGARAVRPAHFAQAVASADAFDAAVSALEMSLHGSALERLRRPSDRQTLLEGEIWAPTG